ncbi:hypothetical protein P280DRAFT_465099 [Massarina eburnea CBS 473.64]|uniref:Uncharacterized protein n=1 Tax=Massarina eburnea CBS 473.64 TaxID=1395130 RepID=A0A6A6SEA8_9PLEO|nr:hypothetical protein P280DRAFT_465099 [Massarina eburnea CBS 473.64]
MAIRSKSTSDPASDPTPDIDTNPLPIDCRSRSRSTSNPLLLMTPQPKFHDPTHKISNVVVSLQNF